MLKKRITSLILIVILSTILMLGIASAAPTVDCSTVFAGNTFVTSCDAVNALNSYTTSTDAWGIYQRVNPGQNAGDPHQCFDETNTGSPTDSLGIIRSGYTEQFFCIVDTNNGDTGGADQVLELVFDISGAGALSAISVDLAAMGDFEASNDSLHFEYSIDAGPYSTLIESSVNEDGSLIYTMENGSTQNLSDPMTIGTGGGSCPSGTTLNNQFTNCQVPISGSGTSLTLRVTANSDGGSEVMVFDHIVISGTTGRPTDITLSSVSATGYNPGMLALALAAILAIGAGAFVLRRRAVL